MTLRKSLKDSEPPFPHLPSAAAMTLNPRPPVEEVEGHGVGVGHMKRHQGLDCENLGCAIACLTSTGISYSFTASPREAPVLPSDTATQQLASRQ